MIFNEIGRAVMQISPSGGVKSQITWQIPKGNCRLPVFINVNFCSISCRFPVMSDFSDFVCETGSDVTPISPSGGVKSQIKWQILQGNCRLPICD